MKTILITGPQGSGKTRKAFELMGLGKKFIAIDANNIYDRSQYIGIQQGCIVIVDEVSTKNIFRVTGLISRGSLWCRMPLHENSIEFEISELYVLSQEDVSKFINDEYEHIKL